MTPVGRGTTTDSAAATVWGPRPTLELTAALADSLGWPRTRSARLVIGDRAERVSSFVIVAGDRELATMDASADDAVLLASPSIGDPRAGRRMTDALLVRTGGADGNPNDWRERLRTVIDASEMLAGGVGGFDERLLVELDLEPAGPLHAIARGELKLVAFVPEDALEEVRAAVFAAGAGVIGDYAECSWSTAGTGTFRGSDDAEPAIGEPGEFTQVAEVRFETVVPAHRRDAVARAFVDASPYEEPAFDFLSLETPARVGIGRLAWSAGGVQPVLDRLRAATGVLEVDRVADLEQGNADVLVAITSGSLSPVLGDVLFAAEEEALALVIASNATTAERELLAERGIVLALIDRDRLVATYGDAVAAHLSRELRVPVSRHSSLSFPAGAAPLSAEPDGDRDDELAPRKPVSMSTKTPSRMWFDGGSRGNPGPAAAAFVLYDNDGDLVEASGLYLGRATNNVAEYTGLINGIRRAIELGATRIEVFGDSQLIVKQVRGEYKVKHADMKPLHATAMQLLKTLAGGFQITHVLRGGNAEADAMVNQTLDAHGR